MRIFKACIIGEAGAYLRYVTVWRGKEVRNMPHKIEKL